MSQFIENITPSLFELIFKNELFAEQFGDCCCLRMRINEDQRDDECINTKRLDHSQTDQQGNGDFAGRFGISCDAFNCGF